MTQESTQATTASTLPQAPEQIQSTWTSFVPMILIFVVFYFLLIRPQEKKRKSQEQLISTVKPGEDVLTHSGIYGKVSSVNENDGTITVEVAKGVEMKFLKTAVADIISRKKAIISTPAPVAAKIEKAKVSAPVVKAKPAALAVKKPKPVVKVKSNAKKPIKKAK